MTDRLEELPAALIVAGNNDRTHFDEAELEVLAKSIAEHGLAQRPVVRPIRSHFEIVCGERRYRAMTAKLGWVTVPVVVRDLDDRAASSVMLTENVARADLTPSEEARAYQKRIDELGLDAAGVATMAGVSWNRVDAKVRLLRLIPEALLAVDRGLLPETWAWRMDRLDVNRQRLAFKLTGELHSHSQFSALCSRLQAEQDAEPLFDPDTFLQTESYLASARKDAKASKPEQMRRVIAELLDWAHDAPDDLTARARVLLSNRPTGERARKESNG